MIPKSGNRFSDQIMLKKKLTPMADTDRKLSAATAESIS